MVEGATNQLGDWAKERCGRLRSIGGYVPPRTGHMIGSFGSGASVGGTVPLLKEAPHRGESSSLPWTMDHSITCS